MRLLVDNNLSPRLAERLGVAGHDVVHVRDIGLQAATDSIVLKRAQAENRVLVSADTDFGTLLARSHAACPSILLIRRLTGRRAAHQFEIIQGNLPYVADDLAAGAVVVISDYRVRVRLPLPG
jgi:predicted nuclease of predicted toxin-antitoxin system